MSIVFATGIYSKPLVTRDFRFGLDTFHLWNETREYLGEGVFDYPRLGQDDLLAVTSNVRGCSSISSTGRSDDRSSKRRFAHQIMTVC